MSSVAMIASATMINRCAHPGPASEGPGPERRVTRSPAETRKQSAGGSPGSASSTPAGPEPNDERPPPRAALDETLDETLATSYTQALEIRTRRRLEERWKQEAPDPEWTRRVRSYFSAEFHRLEISPRIEEVDCRAMVCRAVIEFEGSRDFQRAYALDPLPNHTYSTVQQHGDRRVVFYYLAREGTLLKWITQDQTL